MKEMELAIDPATAGELPEHERSLVERAKSDREAFATLYRLHYPAVARYVRRRTGDPHVTDDLVADVFLNALRALPRYRQRGVPIRAWLFRIATNRVNRWARRERRKGPGESLAEAGVDDRARDQSMTAEWARTALLAIAPRYQAVLSLHYLEGLTLEAIAVVVGCRPGTVKSRLSRGRDALRDHLQRRSGS